MKQIGMYFRLECKKFFGALPGILLGTLLIGILLTGFIFVCQKNGQAAKESHTLQIGVAARKEEPYVDWMISAIEHMESLEFTCHFSKIPTELAIEKLSSGELDAVFIIPENYVNSLIQGSKNPLIIRLGTGDSTITGFLIRQIGDAASRFMINTQAGIYTLKDFYRKEGLPDAEAAELDINLKYLDTILKRSELLAVEEIRLENELSGITYYLTSGIVLFLLFLGLTCPGILGREKRSLQEKLQLIHIGSGTQILVRYFALVTVFAAIFFGAALLLSAGLAFSEPSLPGATADGLISWMMCFLRILPIVFPACALLQLVYETTTNKITSVLFLFLLILILGYLSGCFYPMSVLPRKISRIAPFLPLRVMFEYTGGCLVGTWSWKWFFSLFAYSAGLLGITAAFRKISLWRNV